MGKSAQRMDKPVIKASLKPNKAVSKLDSYKQGRSEAPGHEDPIKLSSNESPLGPSPKALKAYHDIGTHLFRYPDGAQHDLRMAIGDVFSLDSDRIVCGNGSEELQLLLARAFLSQGDEVIASEYCFVMGKIHALAQGATVITAPEPDHHPSAEEILKRITPATRMIMIASPNNPVGDYIRKDEFAYLVENTPSHIMIIYDGAYADFVTADDYTDGFATVDQAPNVVVTRTFSKLYGLAGLRVGWMYCDPSVMDPVQRIRTPFNVNIAAMVTAEAAVRDIDYAKVVRDCNARWLARLTTEISAMGLHVFPTVANFYLIRFPETGPHTAAKAADFMIKRGVIPRPVNAGGPAGCLRITVGLHHENEAALEALGEFMRTTE